MNFENQVKILFVLVQELGGSFYKLFEPMLSDVVHCYSYGDLETATQKLDFIGEEVIKAMVSVGICVE